MVAHVVPVDPFDLVVFGATGDLSRRKLMPALFHRMRDGQMPEGARVVGAARGEMDVEGFRRMADEALTEFAGPDGADAAARHCFLAGLDYVRVDAMSNDGGDRLGGTLPDGSDRVRAFYLSVAPRFFGPVVERVHDAGLAGADSRLVVEKSLGHDLASARRLRRAATGRWPTMRAPPGPRMR